MIDYISQNMKLIEHQLKQKEVIDTIERQLKSNALKSSVVLPVEDFEKDPRICLTGIHLPSEQFLSEVQKTIVEPLKEIEPEHYYYPSSSLHITIKNVRVINDPPHFSEEDVKKAKKVFSEIIPRHKKFNAFFYKLLLFPNSISIMGTSDPELDNIVIDLDSALNKAGIPDDKKYVNSRYFFCNMTLARFNGKPGSIFKKKLEEISRKISLPVYAVDSVTLVTSNAVLAKRVLRGTWNMKN